MFFKKQTNSVFLKTLYRHNYIYPTPQNLNYSWSGGSLTGLTFALQLITGILLAMHYVPTDILAFESIEHILRDVNFGYVLKNLHANGAPFIFLFMYIHIARGLLIRSYTNTRLILWKSGIIIFIFMIVTASIGYVLPWGQMSYWGATVITNLITAIPLIGESIAIWIWGDPTVNNATLNRFFSLHYLFPFIILSLIMLHLIILHEIGSSTPITHISSRDNIAFFSNFGTKDLYIFTLTTIIFTFYVFLEPNALGHPDNFLIADPLVTPAHIVPEWYSLPFYAILRAIPDKLLGVLGMLGAILILSITGILGIFHRHALKGTKFQKNQRVLIILFFINFLLLGFIGGHPAENPYVNIGRFASITHFACLLLLEINWSLSLSSTVTNNYEDVITNNYSITLEDDEERRIKNQRGSGIKKSSSVKDIIPSINSYDMSIILDIDPLLFC